MKTGEISFQGLYVTLLLPIPIVVYTMVRGLRKMKLVTSDDSSNSLRQTILIPDFRMKRTNVTMLQLVNVIEGPFRCKTSGEKGGKL